MPLTRHQRIAFPLARRGNALLLVAAVLVLLVITATAFLTRTRSVRSVSSAENVSAAQRDRIETLPDEIAAVISESLFPAPIDPSDPDLFATDPNERWASSNWPRLPRSVVGQVYGEFGRYAVDPTDNFTNATPNVQIPDGLPDYSYNVAPYETRPFTNWPRLLGRLDDQPGEPGTNDNRWLRSNEPFRFDYAGNGIDHRFSHWQHLSYLPTAENGWRVVRDIADVTDAAHAGTGGVVTDLRIPVEQWPQETLLAPALVTTGKGMTGTPWTAVLDNANAAPFVAQFIDYRSYWFDSYDAVYGGAATSLPNLWDLKTLGNPGDEFVPGTKRNIVSRTFADSDGDGLTDSFWMLAPTSGDSTLRQLVAVSIVDNAGMLDANVASRAVHRDSDRLVVAGNVVPRTATAGRTPGELALVGPGSVNFSGMTPGLPGGAGVGVGFLDNVLNQQGALYPTDLYPGANIYFDVDRWATNPDDLTLMDARGIRGNLNFFDQDDDPVAPYLPTPSDLATVGDRLSWWRSGALRRADPRRDLFPFGAPDEIELRAFHAQNIPNVLTRFERSVNTTGADYSFIRSLQRDREETSEYLDQLHLQNPAGPNGASPALFDNRRKTTLFSATRNDTLPAWMWPSPFPPAVNATDPAYIAANDYVEPTKDPSGALPSDPDDYRFTTPINPVFGPQAPAVPAAITAHDLWRWSQLTRKFDLGALVPDPFEMRDLDGNGIISEGPGQLGSNNGDDYALQADEQRGLLRDRLKRILTRVLLSDDAETGYFGDSTDEVKRARSLVASYAANISAWMSGPSFFKVGNSNVVLPVERQLTWDEARTFVDPANTDRRFVGAEKQPYIMEAFFARVYARAEVDPDFVAAGGVLHAGDDTKIPQGMPGEGENFVDGSSKSFVVAAVQIANPYNSPIVLAQREVLNGVGQGAGVPAYRIRFFGRNYQFTFSSCENFPVAGGTFGATQNAQVRRVDVDGDGVIDAEQLLLLPCTEDEPRTAIVYAVPESLDGGNGVPDAFLDEWFGPLWRDFLDIGLAIDQDPSPPPSQPKPYPSVVSRELFEDPRTPMQDTLRFRAGGLTGVPQPWSTTNVNVYDFDGNSSVELYRAEGGSSYFLVDRLDTVDGTAGLPAWEFRDAVKRLDQDPAHIVPPQGFTFNPNGPPQANSYNGVRIQDRDYLAVWARAARHWRNDFIDDPVGSGTIDNREKAPRYAIATRPKTDVVQTQIYDSYTGGSSQKIVATAWGKTQDPDAAGDVWFKSDTGSQRKPTYFTTRSVEQGAGFVYGDGFPVAAPANQIAGTWYTVGSPAKLTIAQKHVNDDPPLDAAWQLIHPDGGAAQGDVFQSGTRIGFASGAAFQRVGDLLLVPLWGPVIEQPTNGTPVVYRTMAELMANCSPEYPVEQTLFANRLRLFDDTDPLDPVVAEIVGPAGTFSPTNPGLHRPFLPAGAALFDAFVCDGPGELPWRNDIFAAAQGGWVVQYNLGGVIQREVAEARSPRNGGGGLDGRNVSSPGTQVLGVPWESLPVDPTIVGTPGPVPGLVNINTAPVEVLRALPHLSWLVHERTDAPGAGWDLASAARARCRLPEAIGQYRDRAFNLDDVKPLYSDRGVDPDGAGPLGWFTGMRSTSGIASIGELLLLRRGSVAQPDPYPATNFSFSAAESERQAEAYRIDFAARNPSFFVTQSWPQVRPQANEQAYNYGASWSGFEDGPTVGTDPADLTVLSSDSQLSTDVYGPIVAPNVNPYGASYVTQGNIPFAAGDGVSGDAEEAGLLFAGVSNMVTTRSDLFTVYFRVRTVRQDPVTGAWNGADRGSIVDEARYVMAVDRSEVKRPGDKPRILYLEKLPP